MIYRAHFLSEQGEPYTSVELEALDLAEALLEACKLLGRREPRALAAGLYGFGFHITREASDGDVA